MKYVFREGHWVPLSDVVQPVTRNHDAVLWNDRAYQDMGDPRFNSRKSHRDYMTQNNLTTVDDYREQWKQQEVQREQFFKGLDPQRREDVMRALEKHRA